MVDIFRPFFDKGPPPIATRLLDLPGLRGAWVGSLASGGNWRDIGAGGNHLVRQGNPRFAYTVPPYQVLDGVGDYFDITDAASGGDFDILGTETEIASAMRGVTVLGWFYATTLPGTWDGLVTKWDAATNNRSYALWMNSLGQVNFSTSDDGTWGAPHNDSVTSSNTVGTGEWFFAAGAWSPTWTKVALGTAADGLVVTWVASGTASLFNGAANLTVGAEHGGAAALDGRGSAPGVCVCYLLDIILKVFYHMTKRSYGH